MKTKKQKTITLLVDTREQKPLDFSPFPDIATEQATLWPGDYTIRGYERSIAFERKSVSDLIGTMKSGYVGRDSIRRYESRFDLELEEFERHYDRYFIIVEPDEPQVVRECASRRGECTDGNVCAGEQISRGWYRAAIPPHVVFSFVRALAVEYGCHLYFADDRDDAAREMAEIARLYVRSRRHVIHREKIAKTEKRKELLQDWC